MPLAPPKGHLSVPAPRKRPPPRAPAHDFRRPHGRDAESWKFRGDAGRCPSVGSGCRRSAASGSCIFRQRGHRPTGERARRIAAASHPPVLPASCIARPYHQCRHIRRRPAANVANSANGLLSGIAIDREPHPRSGPRTDNFFSRLSASAA